MELSGRPLLDTRTDAALLADRRAELDRLAAALDAGLNALLVGPRGYDRTTLLRALARQRRARASQTSVGYTSGAGADSGQQLLSAVTRTLGATPDDVLGLLDSLAAVAAATGRGRFCSTTHRQRLPTS